MDPPMSPKPSAGGGNGIQHPHNKCRGQVIKVASSQRCQRKETDICSIIMHQTWFSHDLEREHAQMQVKV